MTHKLFRLVVPTAVLAMALTVWVSAGVPQDSWQARARGQAQFEERRYAEAETAFAAVVEGQDLVAADWVNLALARYELGDDAGALQALAAAGELEPDDVSVHYLRGLVARRTGDNEAARAALSRAVGLDPTDPAILYNLGATLEALGDAGAAGERYEAVIAMGFDIGLQQYVSSLYRAGFLLARSGDQQAARPYLERYQQDSRRLSQAQRAPAALEVGRYKAVRVAVRNLATAADDWRSLVFEPATPGNAGSARQWLLRQSPGSPPVLIGGGSETLRLLTGDGPLQIAAASGPMALGDYDRDGTADLYVAAAGGGVLLRGGDEDAAAFERTDIEMPPHGVANDVVWVDADHDGDLDLVVAEAAAPGVRLLQNRGGGAFVDVTADTGMAGDAATTLVWADFDADNDVDLYVLRASGGQLFTNVRFGRFDDIAAAVGASAPPRATDVIAEDLDNDGALDLAITSATGLTLLRNTGAGTFLPAEARLPELGPVSALHAGDFNLDGFLDLVVQSAGGPRLLVARGSWEWVEGSLPVAADDRVQGIADVDADGAPDLLVSRAGEPRWLRQPAPLAHWLRVSLGGIKNNLEGIGSLVEVKAGGLYLARPMRDAVVTLGLGEREVADVLRVTWPNGIVQNETDVAADRALGPIAEVERLEGSCPLLYTWNGERWVFVNEVLGVAPLGMPLAAGIIHPADFDEYVPVAGDSLRSDGDGWEIRLTEELREAGFIDAVRLLAVDSPANLTVVVDERFSAPPHPEFRLFPVERRLGVEAVDQDGNDWTAALREVDGDWTAPFAPQLYEGLATDHFLELRLPQAAPEAPLRLFLTGWVYWATGSINLQVDDDPRVAFTPVSLQVPDGDGGWRTAIEDIGLPNGKNSTLSVDLTGVLMPGDPRLRLATTMRLYWDAAWYATGDAAVQGLRPTGDWQQQWGVPRPGPLSLAPVAGAGPVRLTVLEPAEAQLRFRGFSELRRGKDGFEWFDYQTVGLSAPWNQHVGRYTRYGDVGELVQAADDRYVVLGTGDELSVRLRGELPALPEGWRRDWLVYLNGWVKDGDPNTVHGDRVEPLPFHAMSGYPYLPDESYPESSEYGDYQLRYNTRSERRINESLRPR